MIFEDAWNPSPEEIRAWAYSNDNIPQQDWELAVNCFENIPMLCTFIDDEACKHTSFFLSCLYVFTGDIVRSGKTEDMLRLSMLADQVAKTAQSEQLINWLERSKHLIRHPHEYHYDYWGLGSKYVY